MRDDEFAIDEALVARLRGRRIDPAGVPVAGLGCGDRSEVHDRA